MATKEELSEQLNITQKLAAITNTMAAALGRVESSYSTQVESVKELTRVIEILGNKDLSGLNEAKLGKIQRELKKTTGLTSTFTEKLQEQASFLKGKFSKAVAAGAAALIGLGQGFRTLLALGKGIGGLFSTLISSVASLTVSILSIPFQIFGKLVKAAAQAGGGTNELAEAIREVMIQFGDLKGPGASAVMTTASSLRGFEATGLSAFRVFGNIAQRIKEVNKIATAMGSTFSMLTQEFVENGGALLAYQKGLGVSEEAMKAVGDRALTMGKPMAKVFNDMTKQTLALGKAFNLDQKVIGRDVANAMKDVKHFGALAVKEIAQAAVYARKFGVELDKIAGTLDAFETFDTAAENTAKLSQAFGVQIDAFKMMEAQNPAEQINMLRKSFKAAGVDASTFTRQQAKLLAQTTNLSEETVRQVFSMKNQGAEFDDIKKKSEGAEKKMLSQEEAMGKLADSIERLVMQGNMNQEGGFWQQFLQGISRGIQSSREFRSIIWNIKIALMTVMREGVRLGRAIVDIFPGVKEMMGGIAEFFQPAKFKILAGGVTDVFIKFFRGLRKGDWSFEKLMKDLQDVFFNFFNKEMPAGKKMLEGFKTFTTTLKLIFVEAIKWIADRVASGIRTMTTVIADLIKGNVPIDVSGAKGGIGFMYDIFKSLAASLKYAWEVLSPAMWDLVLLIGMNLKKYFTSDKFLGMLSTIAEPVAYALFGPALIRAGISVLITTLGPAILSWLATGGKKVYSAIAGKAAEVAQSAAAANVPSGSDAMGAIEKTAAGGGKAISAAEKWGATDAVKLGLKLFALATALAVGGMMLAGALRVMMWELGDAVNDPKKLIAPLSVITTVALASLPMMAAIRLAGQANPKDILIGAASIGAAVFIAGLAGGLISALLVEHSAGQLKKATDFMWNMSLIFLAMIPVILAAAGLGVVVAATGGTALLAIGAGLAIIGGAIGEMSGLAVLILNNLKGIPASNEMKQKVDMFIDVMKVIQALLDVFVKIIDKLQPSFTDLFTRGDTFVNRSTAVKDVIESMIGKKGSDSGVIGLIEIVLKAIKEMKLADGLAEKAKVFSSIMNAVTAAMEAMKPPDAFFEAGTGLINRLSGNNIESVTKNVTNFVKTMKDLLVEMINDGILPLVNSLTSISVPNPAETQAVTQVVSSISGIMQSLSPDTSSMKEFINVSDDKWGPFGEKVSKFDGKGAVEFLMAAKLQMVMLMPIIGMNLGMIVSMMSGFNTQQIESMKAVGPIMSSVAGVITSVMQGIKGKKVTPTEVNGVLMFAIEDAPDYAALFEGLGKSLPQMFKAVKDTIEGIEIGPGFATNLKSAEQLFGFIKTIVDVTATLSGVQTGGKPLKVTPLVNTIWRVGNFLKRVGREEGPLGLIMRQLTEAPALKNLASTGGMVSKTADQLSTLFKSFGSIIEATSKMTSAQIDKGMVETTMTSLGEIVDVVSKQLPKIEEKFGGDVSSKLLESANLFKAFGDNMTTISTSIKSGGIAPALKAVQEMVKMTQELDNSLTKLPNLDIQAKLTKLAASAGLGGSAVYTVNSKDINITLKVNVVMNVDDVEKVMILRKNSFVRDRINLALNKDNPDAKLGQNRNETPRMPMDTGEADKR